MKKIAVIMGSKSDWEVMKQTCIILETLDIAYSRDVLSAHRTPMHLYDFAQNAKNNGIAVIIAGAGGAAHLPGVVASLTTIPVIGVPIKTSKLSGIDSLLSIVQMPDGIPVATMAINGAKNAGLFAASILAVNDQEIAEKIIAFREKQTENVLKDRKLVI